LGTSSERFGATSRLETCRTELLNQYEKRIDITSRKNSGQFNTPIGVSTDIVAASKRWYSSKTVSVLEPAVGAGSFISALLSEKIAISKVTGVEIDSGYFDIAKKVFAEHPEIAIRNGDFFDTPLSKADLVITNPPYVRHQRLTISQKSALHDKVEAMLKIQTSGLSDLYVYYLLFCHQYMNDNGIGIWLLPTEFMEVNYGQALREYLTNNVKLIQIHRYMHQNTLFEEANVTSAVVVFQNTIPDGQSVRLTSGSSMEKPDQQTRVEINYLKDSNKWNTFFQTESSASIDTDTIGDYFTVRRGIATGDNAFFVLTDDQVRLYSIPSRYLRPILPSPRNLETDLIIGDSEGVPKIKNAQFLLNITDLPDVVKKTSPETWEYLQGGIGTTSERYIAKHRKQWYFQEQREVPPILLSYMSRSHDKSSVSYRFFRNKSLAIANNAYLLLYPKRPMTETELDNLCSRLRRISQNEFDRCGRIYGHGLRKIEPKELPNVRLPK